MKIRYLILVLITGCGITGSDDKIQFSSCHESKEFIEPDQQCLFNSKLDYYRGIWYGQSKLDNEFRYKYAGGLGTYTSHHSPASIYSSEVNKTFFTYGGTRKNYDFNRSSAIGPDQLYIMISYFDHTTKQLAKPTLVFDKWTNDPHDNPVLSIDARGYIWLFAPSHGDITTSSYVLKSKSPYKIDEFTIVEKSLFSYPQPHINETGDGILFYTSYEIGRTLMGRIISNYELSDEIFTVSIIGKGHYQVSVSDSEKIGTAFNYHPSPGGSDARTNLYYLETDYNAGSWRNIKQEMVNIPLKNVINPTLVRDYKSEGYLVYLMDMVFDVDGNPVILYNISTSYLPGGDVTRYLKVAFYRNDVWNFRTISSTDHNYNMGTIYANNNQWIISVPTQAGPQRVAAGGEIELWFSEDSGFLWESKKMLTNDSVFNHNYVRRVLNGKNEFAFIWASGHGYSPSESRLYYSDINGLHVTIMP